MGSTPVPGLERILGSNCRQNKVSKQKSEDKLHMTLSEVLIPDRAKVSLH